MRIVTAPRHGIWEAAGTPAPPPARSVLGKITLEMFDQLSWTARQEFFRKNKKLILQQLAEFRPR